MKNSRIREQFSLSFDFSNVVPGAHVTVDTIADDPKEYEVVEVIDDHVIVRDLESSVLYKVPLFRVSLVDLSPSFGSGELESYRIRDTRELERARERPTEIQLKGFLRTPRFQRKYGSLFRTKG